MDAGNVPGLDSKDWRSGPGLDPLIIKTGVSYLEVDTFQKTALEKHFEGIRAREPSQAGANGEKAHRMESDEKIYNPLNDSQGMRVLELFPGKKEDGICCKLHVCSVGFEYPVNPLDTRLKYYTPHAVSHITGQPVCYTAISYVWGDPAFVKPMTCNGKPFRTTENLDLALRYFRQTDAAVMLWIDQICINQHDLEEKTQQVILMSKIYQHAWNTLAWLGEEANNSSDALETMLTIGGALQYYTDDRVPDLEDFENISLPAPSSQKWSELNEFLRNPWFQRVWIIQEVVLSRKIQLMYGEKCISWSDLSLFSICMVKHDLIQYLDSDGSAREQSGCLRIREIDGMKGYNDTFPNQSNLQSVLVEGRGAEATDLRDKVFAVMGMSSTIINPDYTKGMFDVYAEAARSMLSVDDLMNMLCCVDHTNPAADHPSWIPDWSVARQTTSLGYRGKAHGVYAAAEDSKLLSKATPDGGSIVIFGMLFDTVSNISALVDPSLKDLIQCDSHTGEFVTRSMHLATTHCQPYPSASGLFDAFWHTLVAGKDDSGTIKAPSEFAEIFALLIDCATGSSPSMPDQPTPTRKLTLENLRHRRPGRTYRQMQVAFEAAVRGRRFGTTAKQYMGLFPRGTRDGDRICVFAGGHVPFVVREQQTSSSRYQLVGECYVHGIMKGEAMQMTDLEMDDIELI